MRTFLQFINESKKLTNIKLNDNQKEWLDSLSETLDTDGTIEDLISGRSNNAVHSANTNFGSSKLSKHEAAALWRFTGEQYSVIRDYVKGRKIPDYIERRNEAIEELMGYSASLHIISAIKKLPIIEGTFYRGTNASIMDDVDGVILTSLTKNKDIAKEFGTVRVYKGTAYDLKEFGQAPSEEEVFPKNVKLVKE